MRYRSARFAAGITAVAALAATAIGGPVRAQETPDPTQSSTDQDRSETPMLSLHRVAGIDYPDVRSVTQDSHGFIWLGINHPIEGGLVRHDGYEAKRYRHELDDPTSLSHSQVSLTYIDRNDVLWVGTIRGGLNRYNARTDDFTRYLHDPADDSTLPSDDIETMLHASDGTYWVGTETGLARLDPETGTATSFFPEPDNPNSLPNNRVRAIVEDPVSGNLWVGTSGGLSIVDTTSMTFRNHLSSDAANSLSDDAIEAIARDADGVWWIGTAAGLDRYNPETDDFTRFGADVDTSTLAAAASVQSILADSQNRLWVGGSHGLKQFDRETGSFVDVSDPATLDAVLGQTVVQSIFEDVNGAIWIGTQTQGAARISPIPKGVHYSRHSETDRASIGSDFVARVEATPAGLWLVTDAGVEFFDGNGFTDYTAKFGLDDGWPVVHGLLAPADTPDIIWLGFQDGRLGRVEVDSGAVEYFDVPAPADASPVWPVAEGSNGDVWYRIPWHYGLGVLHADGSSELLIGDDVDPDFPEQAYAFNTAHFFDADRQELWVTGLGLTRVDVVTGDVDVYSFNADNPKAVQNQLWSVDRGPDGNLWLGSSNGVMEFDPTAGTYVGVHNDALPAAGATDARFGPDGRLWVVAGPTLSGMDTRTGEVSVYGFDDAAVASDLLPMENRVSSKLEVGFDGKMYAPTLEQGLLSFDPAALGNNSEPPPVVLTGFELFGQDVAVGGEVLAVPIDLATEVTLASHQNTFTFEFSALGYEHPELNQFRYRLDGFDDEWHVATADRRFATYTNVPSGDYTFRVQASNNSGAWNTEGAGIVITIATPWYESWWTRSLALVGLVALVVALVRWRTARQRARTRDLEERLDERVRHSQERDRLLAEVQEQSERLASILAAAPVGVVLLSPDLDVLLENRLALGEFETLASVDAAGRLRSFAGVEASELIGPERAHPWTTITVTDGGTKRSLSVTVRQIDATSRTPCDDDLPRTDPVRGWVLLWDDITELEELQQRRVRQERLAAVGRFAAGIAHDVNNVLGVIGLKADLLNLDPEVGDEAREHIVHISRETSNAARFITQILDFSRQSVSERRVLDACAVVETQVLSLRDVMGSTTRLQFFGQAPSTIEADPTQLERVVLNLVKNAQDAVGDSGTITVVVDHVSPGLAGVDAIGGSQRPSNDDSPDAWVRLAVHDNGVGIDAEILPTIFEPFVTTKPLGKGTGLGLAQVAGIAAEHGGRVTVETGAGSGTTVSVHFPAANLAEFDLGASPAGSPLAKPRVDQMAMVIEGDLLPQSPSVPARG